MRERNAERGSAMLVTLVLTSALMAGAVALVHVQTSSTRTAEMTRAGISATYCAEAGLIAARNAVAANQGSWQAALAASAAASPNAPAEPAFFASVAHDLDGDGSADFIVYLRDNNDELPPADDDQASDNDLQVYVVSRCLKYSDTPREVAELVSASVNGAGYRSQIGGLNNNGNDNN